MSVSLSATARAAEREPRGGQLAVDERLQQREPLAKRSAEVSPRWRRSVWVVRAAAAAAGSVEATAALAQPDADKATR